MGTMGRLIRGSGVRVLVAVMVLVGGFAIGDTFSGASTVQSNNFTARGTVQSVGDPVPTVPNTTGSFELGNITQSSGNVMQSTTTGELTIYTHNNTRYYKEVSPGNYQRSDFAGTLAPGEVVAVNGRYYRAENGDGWVLLANYIYNPPPPPSPAGVANPKPTSTNDYLLRRHFYVQAVIVHDSAPVRGGGGFRTPLGFTLNTFSFYGCAQPMCHTERIVKAHGGNLVVMNLNTVYWEGVPGGYRKTQDRSAVIKPGLTATVAGRYTWDGADWRFNATHVFSPSVPPGGLSGGYLKTPAQVTRVAPGTYDSNTDTWVGTQWSGPATSFPKAPAQGDITMTLDWHFNALDNEWEFFGSWKINQRNDHSSLAGTISGTAPMNPLGTAEANMTVDQGTGSLNGMTGFGTFDARSVNFSPPDASTPPEHMDGDMVFEIYR